MIFPDDHAASAVDAGVPVLGGLDRFEAIELADSLEALVDELPGAGAVGPDLAAVFPGAAAGAVEHVLRAPGSSKKRLPSSVTVPVMTATSACRFCEYTGLRPVAGKSFPS